MPTSSGRKLDREMRSAFADGWHLSEEGHPMPEGKSGLEGVRRAGWKAQQAALGRAWMEYLREADK